MTYKQMKWFILLTPTVTIGVWEYVRHHYLLPYLSMEAGNWLAPLIVFFVTVTFLTKLFSIMEQVQEELNQARASQAVLEEREKIARELHDGIAQSLFLLSVKMDQLEKNSVSGTGTASYEGLKKTVYQVNEYVRQAINNLRYPPNPIKLPWTDSLNNMVQNFVQDTGLCVHVDWKLEDINLSAKEKVELYSSVHEALLNIRKHANATQVWIHAEKFPKGWVCEISDDGQGYEGDPFQHENRYGLKILKDRAKEMGWRLVLQRESGRTRMEIRKEGPH
ncbi:sensor histidine kinase [Ferviditalea candida]|uniref:histidine kinase n=1 Tax=Ferviditalea candida TaxID=3108399 RepID=A0ABU5ZIN6_9BACL|nr:histidine kinase [Paenibacillaceae bacterium T2]